MTWANCSQAREINATHHRASITQLALRFVGTPIGEHEVVQEHFHHHQLPPMEAICQFCQAVKRKDPTANSCCRSGKVVLASLHDTPQEFKRLCEDSFFLIKFRFYNSNYAWGHGLQKMSGLTSNWQMLEEPVT